MRRGHLRGTVAACFCLAVLAFPGAASAGEDAPVLAGAAAADITAPVGTPMFAYTARSYVFSPDPVALSDRVLQIVADPDLGLYAKSFEPSRGIHTRVMSRAIVLRSGGLKYALVQADLGGLPYGLVQEVARRIKATGIATERILLSATHTHSSMGNIWSVDNSGYAFVGGDAFDPRTFDVVARGIAEAIVAADARLEPARVGVGTAQLTDASRNREFEVYLRNPDRPGDAAGQRADSIDPTVTVVRIDRPDGKPLALWSNFAVHPTSFGDGNALLSGDNAGVALRLTEQAIREETGASGVVDVWTNSAEGDTSPDGDNRRIGDQPVDYVPTDAAQAHLAGKRTSLGILRAWRDAGAHMEADPGIGARRMFFTMDGTKYGRAGGKQEPVGPFPVLGMGVVAETRPSVTSPGSDEPNCSPIDDLAGPGQGEKMPLVGGPGLAPPTVPVSFWRIGRQGIAAFPAEITKKMGERIRNAIVGRSAGALDRVAIAGLTNAYLSYTATPEEYGACTYEGSFTLFGRQQGYAWLSAGEQLATALLRGDPAPRGAAEPLNLTAWTSTSTPARVTPKAGTPVQQPTGVTRYGRAVFRFNGGDPTVDAARGKPFVSLQIADGSAWRTVATDETFSDTTERGSGDVWTETFQFDRCSPTGTYRFRVTGQAAKTLGSPLIGAPVPYTLDSQPFTVAPVTIAAGTASVAGGVASVRPLYPDPGAGALLALPRLVMGATVSLALSDGTTVAATDPDGDGLYTASVGSRSVRSVAVRDDCGNTS